MDGQKRRGLLCLKFDGRFDTLSFSFFFLHVTEFKLTTFAVFHQLLFKKLPCQTTAGLFLNIFLVEYHFKGRGNWNCSPELSIRPTDPDWQETIIIQLWRVAVLSLMCVFSLAVGKDLLFNLLKTSVYLAIYNLYTITLWVGIQLI